MLDINSIICERCGATFIALVRDRFSRLWLIGSAGGSANHRTGGFSAPETWHEPQGLDDIRYELQSAGEGYLHPVAPDEVQDRIRMLPERLTESIEVVRFSSMTRTSQPVSAVWNAVGCEHLPVPHRSFTGRILRTTAESSAQLIESRMFGGEWKQVDGIWTLTWTRETIRDFYLNNVLIHEIGHVNDLRNTNSAARERYANWFATEYGYRTSRGRI